MRGRGVWIDKLLFAFSFDLLSLFLWDALPQGTAYKIENSLYDEADGQYENGRDTAQTAFEMLLN